MTAVEFLHSEYIKIFGELNPSTGKLVEIAYALEQAKEMEKEQMIKFAKHCLDKSIDLDILIAYNQVEIE